jgi:hypothetical protein
LLSRRPLPAGEIRFQNRETGYQSVETIPTRQPPLLIHPVNLMLKQLPLNRDLREIYFAYPTNFVEDRGHLFYSGRLRC